MIKVNLLRNLAVAQGVSPSGGAFDALGGGDAATQKQAGIKAAAMLIFPILLYVYETFNLSTLRGELVAVQTAIQGIEAEKSKFGDLGPRVDKYKKEKARIDEELAIVRGLALSRLREVKSLDALQSLVPQKTWLNKVAIEGTKVKVEGFTTSTEGISELIGALDRSAFFSKIEPKSTSQEMLPSGPAKRFELEFRVGK